MRTIANAETLAGKRVLVRASLNVPIYNGAIVDAARIEGALPTIQFLRDAGARVILVSHHSDGPEVSLAPVRDYLSAHIPVSLVDDFRSDEGKAQLAAMKDGDVVMLENIRRYPGEERNDPAFARDLAAIADIFVNDDFTSAHRTHASIVDVAQLLPSFAGLAFEKEYLFLSQALDAPSPSLAIIGGSKPETKIPLVAALAKKMTNVFVGGVSANVLWQSAGLSIGKSVHLEVRPPIGGRTSKSIAAVCAAKNAHLPCDVRIRDASGGVSVVGPDRVPSDAAIVDAGPETIALLENMIRDAAFILWNGPLGEYEQGYDESTHALARLLANSSARIIAGGGDTVAAIARLNLSDRFTFVSTAGGAMIDFLVRGTLPAIEALQ